MREVSLSSDYNAIHQNGNGLCCIVHRNKRIQRTDYVYVKILKQTHKKETQNESYIALLWLWFLLLKWGIYSHK